MWFQSCKLPTPDLDCYSVLWTQMANRVNRLTAAIADPSIADTGIEIYQPWQQELSQDQQKVT